MIYKFSEICIEKGFIRGPFGSALKKDLFVKKGPDTYKVYEQCVPLEQDKNKGRYYISGEYFRKELKRFEVKDNDFLVSCSGVNYGAIYHLKEPFEKGIINQALLIIRVNPELVDYNYFKYLFNIILKKAIISGTGDSTIPNFPPIDLIKKIEIDIPSLEEQRKIGSILNSIDEQIMRNNKLVQKLQVLAQSIYSSWFIQFNFPNKEGKAYKFSGGKMVYNDEIKREIPEGWEVKKLKDLMFKINRPFDYYNNEKTIDLSVMPSNSFCLADVNSSKNFSTNLFSMKKGDLLFGSIRPYLKKAGLAPCDGAVAGTVHCLNVYNEFDYNFCLLTLCSENMFNYANKASKGTKMPVISCDDLLEYPIVYNKEIIQKFQILNLKEFIPHLIDEIHKLTSLKNILLPILINGQLQ